MDIVNPGRVSETAALFGGVAPKAAEVKPKLSPRAVKTPSWLQLLMETTLEQNQPLWTPPSKYFRASNSGDLCVRSMTFASLGHQVPFAAKTLRIFRTGNAIEDVNVDVLRRAGVLVATNQQANYASPPIRGRFDVRVKRPSDGVNLIGEIKSIHEDGFNKLPPEYDDPDENHENLMLCYPRYVTQLNTYLGSDDIDLEEGFLLFEAKNSQTQRFYFLRRHEELLRTTLERHAEAFVYLDQLQLAPVPNGRDPCSAADKSCSRCNHHYLCKHLLRTAVYLDQVLLADAKLRG